MEVGRKRALSPELAGTPMAKKRSRNSDSPAHVNGAQSPVAVDEIRDNDNLELFRKEAIYRRMQHYSREHDRAQQQVLELERRKSMLEAALAAVETCWAQLVEEIKLLVKADSLPPIDGSIQDIFPLASAISPNSQGLISEQYGKALQKMSSGTKKLVAEFVRMAPSPPSVDEYRARCQQYQSEATLVRSQLNITRNDLHQTECQLAQYKELLTAAETRADRARSQSIIEMEMKATAAKPVTPALLEAEDVNMAGPEPPQQAANNIPNGHTTAEEDEGTRQIALLREQYMKKLSEESAALRSQLDEAKIQLSNPEESTVATSAFYIALLGTASAYKAEAEEAKLGRTSLQQIVAELQSSQQEYREKALLEANVKVEELNSILAKREVDLLRVRDNRDSITQELAAKKSTDTKRAVAFQELKTLADSRSERIDALMSEVKRLKTRLAANAGDEDLLHFLLGDEQVSYSEDLKAKLTAAENHVRSLMTALEQVNGQSPEAAKYIQSEAQARQELLKVKQRLEKFEAIFGPHSTLPPETQALAQALREKEEAIRVLHLEQEQEQAGTDALYAEVDRLSRAWETLDQQNKSKIFDMVALEDKLNKMATEKAKADNKYFATMKLKDALETERKTSARSTERQAKVMEKLAESEKSLTSQLANQDKEMNVLKRILQEYKDRVDDMERQTSESLIKYEGEKKRTAEFKVLVQERDQNLEKLATDARTAEEEITRLRLEIDRAARSRLATAGAPAPREVELQKEVDKLMQLLRCSTCKQELRNQVLLKCMHTFCKQCIDARVTTRQRKCPACNLPFSTGDIQQLYFQ